MKNEYMLPSPVAFDEETLLAFERTGDTMFQAQLQRPFKPRGLMLWDVGSLSVQAFVGTCPQNMVAYGSVPARWFTVAANYEQVVRAFAEGKEPGRGWGDWDVAYPGMLIRLIFDGPVDKVQALMWGHTCKL